MSRKERRLNTLYAVQQATRDGNWITFDTETTGLEGEIIQWAVCAPDGNVLGQGYIKPHSTVEEGALAIHGITDESLADKPRFGEVAPMIWSLLEGKTVLIYNASFDIARLATSLLADAGPDGWKDASVQAREHWLWNSTYPKQENCLKNECVMEWFAVIYGQWHDYFHSYTWQKLETAAAYFDIPAEGAHDAAADARITALVVQKLIELAKQELPEGYHPPCNKECAGGCGKMHGPYRWNEDHTWYCLECGLVAGLNRLCPRCESLGNRHIVADYSIPKKTIAEGTLCWGCQYTVNMESGVWHKCPDCGGTIEATIGVQPRCSYCQLRYEAEEQRKAERNERRRLTQQARRARKREETTRS